MEGEAPRRRSVAELAGKFRETPPAAAAEAEKPVRRRPPRSLQLPKGPQDQQESAPGVTSPLPSKAKRNSALIEKLQANLALSPSAPLKSPGFRLLPPAFGPPSPAASTPTPVLATPPSPAAAPPVTEEEGPSSFETPPTAAEGCVLLSVNKGRARHSIRRRPPSRRHRKSSCGDEVGVADDASDTQLSPPSDGAGGDERKHPDASTPLQRDESTEDHEAERRGGGASSEPQEDEEEEEEMEVQEKQKEEEEEEETLEQIHKPAGGGTDGTETETKEETPDSTR